MPDRPWNREHDGRTYEGVVRSEPRPREAAPSDFFSETVDDESEPCDPEPSHLRQATYAAEAAGDAAAEQHPGYEDGGRDRQRSQCSGVPAGGNSEAARARPEFLPRVDADEN